MAQIKAIIDYTSSVVAASTTQSQEKSPLSVDIDHDLTDLYQEVVNLLKHNHATIDYSKSLKPAIKELLLDAQQELLQIDKVQDQQEQLKTTSGTLKKH